MVRDPFWWVGARLTVAMMVHTEAKILCMIGGDGR